jgi:hypothetical protein
MSVNEPVDHGSTATILEPLTTLECAYLLEQWGKALTAIADAGASVLWQEMMNLRVDTREVFERKFFEVN